jgi:hypothetical protein
MNTPADNSDSQVEMVDRYVGEFQRRLHDFEQARQEELRHLRHDFIARLIGDHIVIGDKPSYDCMLQGMLKEDERERLETDPGFTKAWRIFVDLCWLKRQLFRVALVVGAIILSLLLVVACFLALPYLANPNHK